MRASDCIFLFQTDALPSSKKYYMFETLDETLSCISLFLLHLLIFSGVLTNCENLIKVKSEEPVQKFKYSIKMLFEIIDEVVDLAILRYLCRFGEII